MTVTVVAQGIRAQPVRAVQNSDGMYCGRLPKERLADVAQLEGGEGTFRIVELPDLVVLAGLVAFKGATAAFDVVMKVEGYRAGRCSQVEEA